MNIKFEKAKLKEGFGFIIGVDEVGRGSLAGPVVSAAVAVPCNMKHEAYSKRVKDSKLLTSAKREELAPVIKQNFITAIGQASEKEIDKLNIHHATLLAMQRAVKKLLKLVSSKTSPNFIAVDGKFTFPLLNAPQAAIIDGDNKIFSIAAASIVAKVYRDNLMSGLHKQYPCYGFNQHKGYGTLHHRQMIKKYGLCPIHRKTFSNNAN